MQNLIDSSTIYHDFQGLAELKLNARKENEQNSRAVAEQFEALFIQSMLKSMRAASPGDSLTDNDQTKLYQDMMDKQLSLNMSKAGGIGIADTIERQLNYANNHLSDDRNTSHSLHNKSISFANGLWRSEPSENSVTKSTSDTTITKDKHELLNSDNPKQYIESIAPYIKEAAGKLKTSPDVLLAISALETGWGKHISLAANGNSSFNLFGIKAIDPLSENHIFANTLEFREGEYITSREPFRVYTNPQESIEDFANFILKNPRYSNALQQSHKPEAFIREIQKAGYATDPEYANKVIAVMQTIDEVMQRGSSSTKNIL